MTAAGRREAAHGSMRPTLHTRADEASVGFPGLPEQRATERAGSCRQQRFILLAWRLGAWAQGPDPPQTGGQPCPLQPSVALAVLVLLVSGCMTAIPASIVAWRPSLWARSQCSDPPPLRRTRSPGEGPSHLQRPPFQKTLPAWAPGVKT